MSNSNNLHMIRCLLDTRRFYDFSKRRGLLNQSCDDGYAVHSLMSELWGEMAPKPYIVTSRQMQTITVLGYSIHSRDKLVNYAEAFADPACHSIVDWQRFDVKPMPQSWATGSTIGFTVRVCPVKRSRASNQYHSCERVERDAYLAYLEEKLAQEKNNQPQLSRFEFYSHWLQQELERDNGSKVQHISVDSFQIVKLQRRNNVRKVAVSQRPDVTLRGTLTVQDGLLFQKLLERGIGRHRAFGFGMLLLHPVREKSC